MAGEGFGSNVLPEMSTENELAPRSLSDGQCRRVVSLDGNDWGVYTDSVPGVDQKRAAAKPPCMRPALDMPRGPAVAVEYSHQASEGVCQTLILTDTAGSGAWRAQLARLGERNSITSITRLRELRPA